MSMTAVPISIRLVRAPTAASSGKGDASCLAKWCTRKYAPSAPSSSAATARSIDCSSASDADWLCEPGDGVQFHRVEQDGRSELREGGSGRGRVQDDSGEVALPCGLVALADPDGRVRP